MSDNKGKVDSHKDVLLTANVPEFACAAGQLRDLVLKLLVTVLKLETVLESKLLSLAIDNSRVPGGRIRV